MYKVETPLEHAGPVFTPPYLPVLQESLKNANFIDAEYFNAENYLKSEKCPALRYLHKEVGYISKMVELSYIECNVGRRTGAY